MEKSLTRDFPAIVAFVRVVEAKSFVAAAQQLKMTASGVSRAVSRLESQLEVRLLSRSTRALSVTEEGAELYAKCAQILADIDAATESVGQSRLRLAGKLRVAVTSFIGRTWLIPHLADFQAHYPDIQLELTMGDRAIDLIEAGIDCAIRAGELADSSLVARRIGRPRVVTCAAPAYLDRFGAPASVEDLGAHRCIAYVSENTGKIKPWHFEIDDNRFSLDVDAHLRINDAASIMHAAVKGLGITQTGDYVAAPHLKRGELKLILAETVTLGPPVWIVYPQRKLLTARTEAFIDWITDLFGRSTQLCSSFGVKPCVYAPRMTASRPDAGEAVPALAE